ncbi:pseudouridylate synthase 7 homolog [Penaeus indicus]|uniref:pseudouridylate synthase 7 homolog n=1 Tax=Penaeus indicus TaxID=29960 RepID=UPI00300C31DE
MEDQPGQAESAAKEENKTKNEELAPESQDARKENGDTTKDVEMAESKAKESSTLGKGMIIFDDDDISDREDTPREGGDAKTQKKDIAKPPRSIEKEVGITQYVGAHEGFFGILKQRYSDFQVNEVSSSGEVVHLTDLSVPPEPQEIPEAPAEIPPELTPQKMVEIDKLLGRPLRLVPSQPSKAEEMEDPATNEKDEEKGDDAEVRICVDNVDKEGRTAIHKTIKAKYLNVDSLFKEDNGKKFIVVRRKKAKGGCRQVRKSWPRSKQFTTFVLYKENVDTIVAINLIAYKIRSADALWMQSLCIRRQRYYIYGSSWKVANLLIDQPCPHSEIPYERLEMHSLFFKSISGIRTPTPVAQEDRVGITVDCNGGYHEGM